MTNAHVLSKVFSVAPAIGVARHFVLQPLPLAKPQQPRTCTQAGARHSLLARAGTDANRHTPALRTRCTLQSYTRSYRAGIRAVWLLRPSILRAAIRVATTPASLRHSTAHNTTQSPRKAEPAILVFISHGGRFIDKK